MTMTAEADWVRAVTLIDEADQVWLACHIRPDADALGSMLAVGCALAARRRPPATLAASFGEDPPVVPDTLKFLPGLDLLQPPASYPLRPELMICFDASAIDRLGLLAGRALAAEQLIVLDHHASNSGFGTVNLVDPAACATAVLATDLISRLHIPLTSQVALGLYAGLVADTGSFRYSATTARVHELAAELLRTGIDPGTVSRELYDRAPFSFLGLAAAALGRAVLEPGSAGGLGLVWTTVTKADRAHARLPIDAAESVIDQIRRTDEAEVAAVLKEADDGTWLASVRSKAVIDVGNVCSALGGGGHARAAGFSYSGAASAAIAALRRELDRR